MKPFHIIALIILALAATIIWTGFTPSHAKHNMPLGENLMTEKPSSYPAATFAGGCFWCTESEYRALNGVLHTRVGYMGGKLENPTYKDISTGKTGHAEVVEITYDPTRISYENLVEFFLTKAHDPTQLNRQGVDIGTQYRSAIFYANDDEKQIAHALIDRLAAEKHYKKPVVTTLEPRSTFWNAEEYHQQYYEKYEAENGVPHIRVAQKKIIKSVKPPPSQK